MILINLFEDLEKNAVFEVTQVQEAVGGLQKIGKFFLVEGSL